MYHTQNTRTISIHLKLLGFKHSLRYVDEVSSSNAPIGICQVIVAHNKPRAGHSTGCLTPKLRKLRLGVLAHCRCLWGVVRYVTGYAALWRTDLTVTLGHNCVLQSHGSWSTGPCRISRSLFARVYVRSFYNILWCLCSRNFFVFFSFFSSLLLIYGDLAGRSQSRLPSATAAIWSALRFQSLSLSRVTFGDVEGGLRLFLLPYLMSFA